jgi:5-(carboxyamino)imidazole ribonucleotide mutase
MTLVPWRAEEDMAEEKPVVGVVMGSQSDWDVMQHAAKVLKDFGVPFEHRVVSAHRTPDAMFEYAESARERGLACIIAGAGGSAHLPGMVASKTTLPVLGVPVPTRHLAGQDSLYSIVQMPKGIPVATFAIGEAGAANAGLFAVSLLAATDAELARKLAEYRDKLREQVTAMQLPDVL